MDWNLFWTAFGAIGGTIGGIATFAAVVVALWQTKISYKKKLQTSFTDDIAVVPQNGNSTYHYVGVTVTNIGNRDVVINNWGFMCHNKTRTLILPETSLIGSMLQTKLPRKLHIEEGINLYFDKTTFHDILDEYNRKGILNPKKKIKFFVTDSTAKDYYILTKKSVSELLNNSITKHSD